MPCSKESGGVSRKANRALLLLLLTLLRLPAPLLLLLLLLDLGPSCDSAAAAIVPSCVLVVLRCNVTAM
jgi:hypothetical protein